MSTWYTHFINFAFFYFKFEMGMFIHANLDKNNLLSAKRLAPDFLNKRFTDESHMYCIRKHG